MPRPARKPIDRFGDRLDWIRNNLVASGPVKHPAQIHGDRDLRLAVYKYLEDTSPHNVFDDRTWTRWRTKGTASDAALVAIRAIYPISASNGFDLFACEWETFEVATAKATLARTRWLCAIEFFQKNRGQVEAFGKAVYHEVDQFGPDFPLLGAKSWLPAQAILLERGETTHNVRWMADHSKIGTRSISLPDLLPPFHLLKLSSLRRSKAPPFNGDCYLISDLKSENERWEFKLRRGRYFDYIDTCEAHSALLSDLINLGVEPCSTAVDQMLQQVGWSRESILDWTTRSTFAGVNCLLITTNFHETDPSKGKTRFWIHRRGSTTVEAQGVWHVAPAGGHQPITKGHANPEEMSFWYTAVRELLEEIFGRDDLSKHGIDDTDPFTRDSKTQAIYQAVIASGAAKVFYLGVGLDPATSKPEVLCTIVLDWALADEYYFRQKTIHLAKELTKSWEGDLYPHAFNLDQMRALAGTPHPGETMLPAGAACLLLTAQHIENGSISIK